MDVIYRIENEKGIGPYKANGYFRQDNFPAELKDYPLPFLFSHDDDCDASHPHPRFDSGIHRHTKRGEFCGFESLDQLIKWFDGEALDILESKGFTIHICQAEITARGSSQVLFNKVA